MIVSLTAVPVPVGPRSLSVLEEAGALLLANGGLRLGAALWMPDGIPVICGLGKPEVGCLDPNISTGGKWCGQCGAHTSRLDGNIIAKSKTVVK